MAYTYPPPAPFWSAVAGFFDYADLYQEFVTRAKDGDVIVEVGCYLGRSGCFLGELIKASKKKITLLCVDTWPVPYAHKDGSGIVIESPFETFYANMRQSFLTKIIVPIRAESVWAAQFVRNELAAVFIDGEHDYDNCLADIKAWLPKVRSGGILAGHDYSDTFPGVMKAANEMFGKKLRFMGQCWIYDKP